MTGLSIHVVDVARGVVAKGLRVRVERLEDVGRTVIAEGIIGDNGLLASPEISVRLPSGTYEATFEIGDYLRREDRNPEIIRFLDVTPFRFGINDPHAHYHLPFKFTAWGFSCFRGGA
jgi:5-hydroxyisourate hydrolase